MTANSGRKTAERLTISELGGKAYNLYRIKRVHHANFFVLCAGFFDALPADQAGRLHAVETAIKGRIKKDKKYAVRSSAIGEDSGEHSFAGVMESFLSVACVDIPQTVLNCHASAFSERAVAYRKINNLPYQISSIRSAVIVQEMVAAEYAGVINTVNPVTNNPDEVFISVIRGLGERLVSGQADSMDFVVDDTGIKSGNSELVPDKLVKKLFNLACTVQAQCNRFQDIEFAVYKGKVFFLQTRDIVPYKNIDLTKPTTVLDNSNIIESFCGPVSPLTFSFALEMYKNVYTEALKQGGISKKLLQSLTPYTENMLTYYEHRVYYNLNSWYKLTGIFPNAKTNTRRMERMMGFSTGMKNQRLKMSLLDTAKFIFNFLRRLKNIEKDSRQFLDDFYREIYPYGISDFAGYSEKQLIDTYNAVAQKTIPWYTVPTVNDNGAMIAYGKLTKFVSGLDIPDKEGFISSLFISLGGVESIESASMFYDIADTIQANAEIKRDFIELDEEALCEKYRGADFGKQLAAYIQKFGARVADELKLETITMVQNPVLLYGLLKTHTQNNIKRPERVRAEVPSLNLTGYKQKKFDKLVKKTAYFIRNRERLRLTRTHTFSAVRNIVLRLGQLYFKRGALENPRDIFYLTKQEAFALAGNEAAKEYKTLIKTRKAEYDLSASKTVPDRMIFFGEQRLDIQKSISAANGLCGIPSGAGKVTGKVKLVLDPKSAVIRGEIILAERTDPGWITLFPLCSGLIVEYGSVLSHSAVAAREMGIPAVVGLKGATKLITDGATVTLDAIKGTVTVHE
ncbi:MAG: PEP-utilizing enzyme [Firmicutes bacterium]|nr:PEP-utilizing enzyme [Bacillota bacterium]